jgi:hypothetical protein
VAAAAGCYRPSIEPCKLACSSAGTCPGDLVCTPGGMCAASMADTCSGDGGALADARPDTSCGWPVITNLDPCMLGADMATDAWTVSTTWTVDTGLLTATTTGSTLPVIEVAQTLAEPSLPMVALIKVRTLEVQQTGTITVRGPRPLVILVNDTATINGTIRVETVPATLECDTPGADAANSEHGSGGGGGGGFGVNDRNTAGAAGGAGAGASGQPGGLPGAGGGADASPGALALSPLRPGCSGGRGGSHQGGALYDNRGRGGGAIQIAARVRISIVNIGPVTSGRIEAGGGGGGPGPDDDGTGISLVGAGGGGSGGAILIEAPTVVLNGARLCANGGGGGGSSDNLDSGSAGGCSTQGAFGGGGYGGYGGEGGRGGTGPQDATPGSASIGTSVAGGGGGGGGGVGRIRINGMLTANQSTLSTPAYVNN